MASSAPARPITAQILECAATDQERVGSAVLPVQLLEQVAVVGIGLPLRVEPVIQHLDRTVDGDVLRYRQRAHCCLLRYPNRPAAQPYESHAHAEESTRRRHRSARTQHQHRKHRHTHSDSARHTVDLGAALAGVA